MENIPYIVSINGTCALKAAPERPVITKEIGGTTYEVFVSFSKTSKESINDKILRLIKNDMGSR